MNIGIILAGGEGTRLKIENANKTSIQFNGKPLVRYGVELFQRLADKTLVVVGSKADSVKAAVNDESVLYAVQEQRLGTGHAVQVAVAKLTELGLEPKTILVGYGDHMMFYTEEIITEMLSLHTSHKAAITLVSTEYEDPNALAWGRVIRNEKGNVAEVVEQKDATEEQRAIQELNTGFYCFDYAFLKEALQQLKPSPHSNEYYITDLVKIAVEMHSDVLAFNIPFKFVGIGINTREQLEESQRLYNNLSK